MSHPFFGDFILENLTRKYLLPIYPWKIENGDFGSDTWISDFTTGIPTNWLWSNPGKFHHNSIDPVDFNLAKNITSIIAIYAYLLATEDKTAEDFLKETSLYEAKKKIMDFYQNLSNETQGLKGALTKRNFFAQYIRESIRSLEKFGFKITSLQKEVEVKERREWRRIKNRFFIPSEKEVLTSRDKMAKNMIPERKSTGIPFSLAKIPHSKRQSKPDYFDLILNWIDGKRTLFEIFKLAGLEMGRNLNQEEKSKFTKYLLLLSKYGYICI